MENTTKKSKKYNLRKQSENKLAQQPSEVPFTQDNATLDPEQQVYQADLEIQNEELRRSQAELTQARDKYQVLFNSVPVGYFVLNTKNIILDINYTAARMLAATTDKLLQKRFTSLISRNSKPAYYAEIIQVLKERRQREIDLEMVREDRSHFLAHLYALPVKDDEGKSFQVRIAMTDVTQRQRIEEKLSQSESLLKSFFESPGVMRGIVEVVDDSTIRHILANHEAAQFIGLTPEKLRNKLSSELGEPREVIQGWIEAAKQSQRTGKPVVYEYIDKRHGRPIWLSDVVSYIDTTHEGKLRYIYVTLDITARKQAEEALNESEEKYRNLVEVTSDFIWEVNQDGIYTYVSPKIFDILGYQPEEVLGKTPFDLMPPEEAERINKIFQKHIFQKKPLNSLENINRHKDGHLVVLDTSGVPFYGAKGELRGYRGIDRDITRRKEEEGALAKAKNELEIKVRERTAQLSESEAKANALIKYAPTMIYESNIRGTRFISVNDAMCIITGYTREELLSLSPVELLDEDSLKRFAEMVESKRNEENFKETADFRARKKDGTFIDITLQATFSRAEPDKVFVIAHDITERKRAEQALIESEVKANALIKYAPAAIFEIDTRGPRFINVNDTMCVISGYSREELLDMNPCDILEENSRRVFDERLKRILAGKGIEQEVDYKARRKDGVLLDVTLQATVSPKDPHIFFVVGHDITERKKMEEALKTYAQRITQIQEDERKRIAYELHDDTAQYLSILKMQIGALSDSKDLQSSKVKEKLQFLEKDADRAFNDVRRYSHELRPVVLEHHGLVAALEQLTEDYNKLGQLSVKMKVGGEEPRLSEEVKLGFFRIAQEALNNTRKHSKATKANIILTFRERKVEMLVTDNGIGFDAREVDSKASSRGSLGLMSMRERADLVGANLKIESKPGRGTSLSLEKSL
jgi:PAS domain S-box-containing protein